MTGMKIVTAERLLPNHLPRSGLKYLKLGSPPSDTTTYLPRTDDRISFPMTGESHMEHRLFQRFPISLDVIIYNEGLPVLASRTHDISRNGMFLESLSFAFSKDRMIEVRFRSPEDEGCVYYRVPAMVVRRTVVGAGLMLDIPSPRDLRALERLLSQAKKRQESLA